MHLLTGASLVLLLAEYVLDTRLFHLLLPDLHESIISLLKRLYPDCIRRLLRGVAVEGVFDKVESFEKQDLICLVLDDCLS